MFSVGFSARQLAGVSPPVSLSAVPGSDGLDAPILVADLRKVSDVLGWWPRRDLSDILRDRARACAHRPLGAAVPA